MNKALTLSTCLFTLLLCGCSIFGSKEAQKSFLQQKKVYIPHVGVPDRLCKKPLFAPVKLRMFHALPPWNEHGFVIRRGGGEYALDAYHGWVAQPADLVAVETGRYLEKAGLFKVVHPSESGSVPSLGLEGFLTEWVLDYSNPRKPVASVGLRLIVLDEESPNFTALFSVEKGARVPLSELSEGGGIQAFSEALGETLSQLCEALKRAPLPGERETPRQ